MKKEHQLKIKRDVYNYAWDKYKNEYTMQELAIEVFNASLASFYRRIEKINKGREKVN